MGDHETGEHVGRTGEQRGGPFQIKRRRQHVHPPSGENIVGDDHEFKPVEIQPAVSDEEGESGAREIEDRRLDVGHERHAGKCVGVPQREMPHGHRCGGKNADGVAVIHHILPQPRLSEENPVEEQNSHPRKQGDRLPITESRAHTVSPCGLLYGAMSWHSGGVTTGGGGYRT